MKEDRNSEGIRLDKWLWAARFFKTRSLAAEAVSGGKVQLNGGRTKPGHVVRTGDEIKVRRGPYEWVVIVRGLESKRGPAAEAQLQYEETEESKEAREALALELRDQGFHGPRTEGRPTKKSRRDILRFRRGAWK
ncbi:MAG: RNA-binding protein [Deltaproteobacteria bacterium]|nr:RNA-binding protein [Deltaproteobacteria bacterium]